MHNYLCKNASILFYSVFRKRNGGLIFQCLQTEDFLKFLQAVIHRLLFTLLRIIPERATDFQKMLFPAGEQSIIILKTQSSGSRN